MMSLKELAREWCRGWALLTRWGEVEGYRRQSFLARRCLDARALGLLLGSPHFWRGAFAFATLSLLLQAMVWELGVTGRTAGLLRLVPAVLAAPAVAVARQRLLRALAAPPDSPTGFTLAQPLPERDDEL